MRNAPHHSCIKNLHKGLTQASSALHWPSSICWFILLVHFQPRAKRGAADAIKSRMAAQPNSAAHIHCCAISCRFLSLLAALTVFRPFQAHPTHGMVHHAAEFFCLPVA